MRISFLPAFCILQSVVCNLQSPVCAQSFFSSRGLGEQVYQSDAASQALGGLFSSSLRNPAYPVLATRSNFTVSALLLGNYAVQDSWQRLTGAGRPEFFRARIPLPWEFRLGLGFSDWYNQDFDVYSESLAAYRRRVVGRGGIYDLDVSLARSFFQSLSVGAEYCRLLGGSNELWRFDAYSGNYVTFDTIGYDYSGNALRFGLCGNLSLLSASAFYEQILGFDIESHIRTHGSLVLDTTLPVRMPARFGGSLAIAPAPGWRILLDVLTQNAAQSTIGGDTLPDLKNALRAVFGVQYLLNDRYPLRFGLRYHDWYLKAAQNRAIREIAVTAGSSLPLAGLGSFDFSLEYANQGTAALKENLLRANLTLYFEEPWKKRTRNWGY
jgi:hypothetical protein